jgi:Mrp family chromosome partitioning ATPase
MRTSGDIVGYTGEPAPPVERRPVLRLTRFQVIVVIISAVITAIVAAVFVSLQPPVYNTTRSVIVLSGSNPNDNDVLSRALESLASSKGMAAEVKRRGDLEMSIDEIAAMISTRRSPESPYMDVVVSSPDQKLSEAVSAQVIPAMRGVFDRNQAELPAEQRIPGPIFQEVFAKPLQSTSTFPVWFAAVFGALLGGLVPYLIFLFRNLRQPVVASAQDVTDAIDLPILVKVPSLSGRGANPQDAVAGVISAVERLSLNEPIHRLVLVGADTSVDRSALALALACVVARSFGQPVALIDADLEYGTLTGLVHAEDVAGLSECLAGQLDPDKALLTLADAQLPSGLDGIAAPEGMVRFLGAGVDRSRNLLRMRSSFHRVLEGLAGRYVVIINGPKVPGPVPTSQLLSLADATLMVVAEGHTSLTDARSAGDTLRSFSSGPAGVVVLRR